MAFCNFCNTEIAKGTGEMYVLKDGTILNFCSSKCRNNGVKLKREGRLVKWTNKTYVLSSGKKVEEKKESAFAKDIEAKLKEKEAAKPAAKK
ncbi:50S ribosomal protein L24e [uncultured archaeon]|nr:50S ribosomal protein L24e [uncultured archaeon]